MEASIAILIAVVVLFAFTLPALLRRTDRAVAQRELNEVPETAEICQRPAAEPCAEEPARPELFAPGTPAARFAPPPGLPVVDTPAEISFRRPAPALAVIDGGAADDEAAIANPAAESAPSEDTEQPAEFIELPLAAGQTLSLSQLRSIATETASTARRSFNPLDTQMMNTSEAGRTPAQRGPAAMPAHMRRRLDSQQARSTGSRAGARPNGQARSGSHTGQPAGSRARGGAPAGASARPARRRPPQLDAETAEKIAGIRSIIPVVSVVFLGMVAAAFITAILAAFGVMPWAVSLLALVIAAGSVLLVGSLNKRVRALRRSAAHPVSDTGAAHAADRREQERRTGELAAARRAHAAEVLDDDELSQPARPTATVPATAAGPVRASAQPRRFPRHILDIDASRQDAQPSASAADQAPRTATATTGAPATAGTASAAPATAGTESGAPAVGAPADGVTDAPLPETPRTETAGQTAAGNAAEATAATEEQTSVEDTTVVVSRSASTVLSLSFGPKTEADTRSADAAAEESRDAGTEAHGATARTASGADAADAGASAPDADSTGDATAAVGEDPFARRLRATGWKPNPLPRPTYVDAPVVAREQPEPVVADATSFTLEPQSKESLAEMFAAELGYRPELEDAARDSQPDDSGPLAHGRTAIRYQATGTASAPGLASVDDVLARRRA